MSDLPPIKLSRHFYERLYERHQIMLDADQQAQVLAAITAVVDKQVWEPGVESVELVCKLEDGRKFTCVYVPWRRAVVTAISNNKPGKHKFKKKILPNLANWVGETREEMAERKALSKRIARRKKQRPREAVHLRRRLQAILQELQLGDEDYGQTE